MRKVYRCVFTFVLVLTICFLAACESSEHTDIENINTVNNRKSSLPELYPAPVHSIGETRWGYIDKAGIFKIQPIYSFAGEFTEAGLAIAGEGDNSGIINIEGKFIVEPQYSYINPFSDGMAIAQRDNTFFAINEKGRIVYESDDYIRDFSSGRALITSRTSDENRLYGYIDKNGDVVIPPRFEGADSFDGERALVELDNGKYAIIDKAGKVIREYDYYWVGQYGDGLLAFKKSYDGMFGYIDEAGRVVIEPRFDSAGKFREGFAEVLADSKKLVRNYGVIDKKGKYVIKPEFNDVLILKEGRLAAGIPIDISNPFKGSKFALVDSKGKLLTDFIFYYLSSFENGTAYAFDGKKTFFIDKEGRPLDDLPVLEGDAILSCYDELCKAIVDGRVEYFKKDGSMIWKETLNIKLNECCEIEERKYKPNRNYIVYYPYITGINNDIQQAINKQIEKIVIREGIKQQEELDYNYISDFKIEFYRKNLMGIEFLSDRYPFGAAHGMPQRNYLHIDLSSGRFYELKDLFKKNSNYTGVIGDIIMKQLEKDKDQHIFPDSYKGIKQDQHFYITGDALHIYFEPYEIASYAAGFPVFTIPFKDIKDIINMEGDFWSSFNS